MNPFYSLLVLVSSIMTVQVHGIQRSNSSDGCGENMVSEKGTFHSPKYPKTYRPNMNCIWKITVPENHRVALNFQAFELEGTGGCQYDYLEIRDGHESSSPVLGKFCGSSVPEDILSSSSNKIAVKFVSDDSGQKGGFVAQFAEDVDECKGDHECEHLCINTFEGYRCECRIGFELKSDGHTCLESCGGIIEEANGTISSPFFPDFYPPNQNCTWEIVAPPKYRIILNFTHFDLESENQGCVYDVVNIRSKMSENEVHEHGTFCGSSLPSVITSKGNNLRIGFESDGSEQESGFDAHFFTDEDECVTNNGGCEDICEDIVGSYTCSCKGGFVLHENRHNCTEIPCGGNVSSGKGIFYSPNYPERYWPNKECTWIITVPENYSVELHFKIFSLERSYNCQKDYLEIRDGDESTSLVLGKLCGYEMPEDILSSSNKMAVKFVSDSFSEPGGFVAAFVKEMDECEGDHGCEQECKNIYGGYQCECRSGYDLHSDGRKCIGLCGGDMSSESGILRNRKANLNKYFPNMDCTWNITVPEGNLVVLKFESFELEDNCNYDYLEIRDGHEPSSPVLGRFCGEEIPEDIRSSSNKMAVKFVSDFSQERAGFVAEFITKLDECTEDHGCEHECINTLENYRCVCRIGFELDTDGRKCVVSCGGVIEEAKGIITSPSFPDFYPPNKNCIWEIIAPPGNRIILNFTHFDLEGDDQMCVYDTLDILSKMPGNEVRNHGTFCGSKLPPVITSESNILRIEFRSDISGQKGGFDSLFFTDEDECVTNNGGCQHICENNIESYTCSCNDSFVLLENLHDCERATCGGDMTSEKGILHSPNYPENYWRNIECTWTITVPENYLVALKFKSFEMESSNDCEDDHLEIWDGHENTSQVLGKFCGDKIPKDIRSSSNKMTVKFISDDLIERGGFVAGFLKELEECKGDNGCQPNFTNILRDVLERVESHLQSTYRRQQG